ncbi:MAG: DUF3047 domain-containing protein [Candidatus Binatia bacterium]
MGRLALCLFVSSVIVIVPMHVTSESTNEGVLETFEGYDGATFPTRWEVREKKGEARKIYTIHEEAGNHFLRAHAETVSVQIGLRYGFSPRPDQRLRWCWRVNQLPVGGDERKAETFDSAAGVYVLFDSRLLPRVVKYVWSSSLPPGTRLQNPLYWRGKTVVLQSGARRTGRWMQEVVNFYQDYRDLFGREPDEVLGIALITSADATKSSAQADYDDFQLLRVTP